MEDIFSNPDYVRQILQYGYASIPSAENVNITFKEISIERQQELRNLLDEEYPHWNDGSISLIRFYLNKLALEDEWDKFLMISSGYIKQSKDWILSYVIFKICKYMNRLDIGQHLIDLLPSDEQYFVDKDSDIRYDSMLYMPYPTRMILADYIDEHDINIMLFGEELDMDRISKIIGTLPDYFIQQVAESPGALTNMEIGVVALLTRDTHLQKYLDEELLECFKQPDKDVVQIYCSILRSYLRSPSYMEDLDHYLNQDYAIMDLDIINARNKINREVHVYYSPCTIFYCQDKWGVFLQEIDVYDVKYLYESRVAKAMALGMQVPVI